jgi:hypothetical protein
MNSASSSSSSSLSFIALGLRLGSGSVIEKCACSVRQFEKVGLVLRESDITPGYAFIEHIVGDQNDRTEIAVVDANKTEDDILLHERLDELMKMGKVKVKVTHV